jgi:hypothetical protein
MVGVVVGHAGSTCWAADAGAGAVGFIGAGMNECSVSVVISPW